VGLWDKTVKQVPLAVYEVDVISGSDYLAVGKKNVTKMETK